MGQRPADRSQHRARIRGEFACCPRLVSGRCAPSPPPRSSSISLSSHPVSHLSAQPPRTLLTLPATHKHAPPIRSRALASLHHYVLTPPLPHRNGAEVPGVLRQGQGDGGGAGHGGGGGGAGAGAGGAVLVAGVRGVAGGGRRGGAAGAGVVVRGARGGGAGVPRRLLGLPRVEGPLRVQRVDGAAEGLRGGAPPRHALHAAGRRAGPRRLRRHRAGQARAGRPRRAPLPLARHEGDVPAAEPDDAAGVLHGLAPRPRGRRRERAGGAVRERRGHRLRPRREQGQVAAERPRGSPAGEGGRRARRRLREEGRVRVRPVPALGRVPRHQVRPRPLRPERRAAGARRSALRPARQRLSLECRARCHLRV